MIIKIYSIKDSKVPAYTQIFSAVSDGIAIRQVKQLIDSDREGYSKFSSDYSLYKVASFDTETGVVAPDFEFVQEFSVIKEIV